MYNLAKIFQGVGLALIAWGFIKSYPALIEPKILIASIIIFIIGWIIQTQMLKK